MPDVATPIADGFACYEDAGEAMRQFRFDAYDCFTGWADAQFAVLDALIAGDGPARGLAELSLRPGCRHGYGSLYQGLRSGSLDVEAARDLLVRQVVYVLNQRWPLRFVIDASVYTRQNTRKVDGLGVCYHGRDAAGRNTLVYGWVYSWLCQVGLPAAGTRRTSWALPMDVVRLGAHDKATRVAVGQIERLLRRLAQLDDLPAAAPLIICDRGYSGPAMTQLLAGQPVQLLVRLRNRATFAHRPQPPAPGTPGRTRLHGPRLRTHHPDTWGEPDATHQHLRPDGATVHTQAWHHIHPVTTHGSDLQDWSGIVEGTLIHQHTTRPGREPQDRFLWWSGPDDSFDITVIAEAYDDRFTIEHLFRYAKHDLGWTNYHPLSAAQADRWTWIIALAITQLHLARPLITTTLLYPWERHTPTERHSPRRVRRTFPRITRHLPNPANAAKPHTPGPGRPPGAKNRTTHPDQPIHRKTSTPHKPKPANPKNPPKP